MSAGQALSRVLIVPGLAVRSYAEMAARQLRTTGHDVELLPAPAWRGTSDELDEYGRQLADRIDSENTPVTVLVGLSVGTQAATVAACRTTLVQNLLLVSPTVDPRLRTRRRLAAAWLLRKEPGGPPPREQLPDWSRAGPIRILSGFDSAVRLPLEDLLPKVTARVVIVHAEHDPLTSHHWAADLAAHHGCRLLLVPSGSHSWPVDDAARFVTVVSELSEAPLQRANHG